MERNCDSVGTDETTWRVASAPERIAPNQAEETGDRGVVHDHEGVRHARESLQNLAHVPHPVPRVGPAVTHSRYRTGSPSQLTGWAAGNGPSEGRFVALCLTDQIGLS